MTEISSNDPAVARRRRKAIINSQRTDADVGTMEQAQEDNASNDTKEQPQPPPPEKQAAPTKKRKAPAAKPKAPEPKQQAQDPSSGTESDAGSKGGKNKKTQIRYDPAVPMNKEQLAAWRREARRVRNRESAAASRQRIRNRISELEEEVGEWKSKYTEAMERLKRLEKGQS